MTPKDLSPDTITKRLVALRELLAALETVGTPTAAELTAEPLQRLAVERILCQLVDLAVSINQHIGASLQDLPSSDYRTSFRQVAASGVIPGDLAAQLELSVGLRNVLTHEYLAVDFEVVAAAIPLARQQYGEYVRSVATWLKQLNAPAETGGPQGCSQRPLPCPEPRQADRVD